MVKLAAQMAERLVVDVSQFVEAYSAEAKMKIVRVVAQLLPAAAYES